jgi:hypothetical protein
MPANGPLSRASVNRLTCLLRHWTWADEALARFEQELAGGWEDDENPVADRLDLEASLPGLRACRRLLLVIPASLEEHPRIVDLLRDDQALGRLRRLHHAFGEALRKEQRSRKLDLLDP